MPRSPWWRRALDPLVLGVLAALLAPGVAVAQAPPGTSPSGTASAHAPPGIPSSVSVAPKDGSAVVSWVAPADDGGDTIFRYTVTASPGGASVDVPGVARTATVTGLTNGVAYRFTVTARNRVGAGPASAVSNAVTPTGPPRAPPARADQRGLRDGRAALQVGGRRDVGGGERAVRAVGARGRRRGGGRTRTWPSTTPS